MSTAVMEQPGTVETFICPGHGRVTLRRAPEQRFCGTECALIVRNGVVERPCGMCGKSFKTANPGAVCSDKCKKNRKAGQRSLGKKRLDARRRERGLGLSTTRKRQIREQHAGENCWLCNLGFIEGDGADKVKQQDKAGRHQVSKTIDHILDGLAEATPDERRADENLTVAHAVCNNKRRRIEEEGTGEQGFRNLVRIATSNVTWEFITAKAGVAA